MISGFMVLLIEMYLRIRGDSSSDTDEGEQYALILLYLFLQK